MVSPIKKSEVFFVFTIENSKNHYSELAKRKNDIPTLQSEQKRKRNLLEEFKLTRAYVSKSEQNRRNYILALKLQLSKFNEQAQEWVLNLVSEKWLII